MMLFSLIGAILLICVIAAFSIVFIFFASASNSHASPISHPQDSKIDYLQEQECVSGDIKPVTDYVVIDFETTGLSPETDEIIEIGMIKFADGDEPECYHSLVNPGRNISTRISELTGLANNDLKNAPHIQDIIYDIFQFIDDNILVAHNAPFDVGFLAAAYRKVGISATIYYIDTVALARRAFPGLSNYKLCTLASTLSLGKEQEHRALSDVALANALLQKCVKRVEPILGKTIVKGPAREKKPMTIAKEHQEIAQWVRDVLTSENLDTEMLAFTFTSKYFRVNCFYPVLNFKLGGKSQYVIIDSRYVKLIDNTLLTPCVQSEGHGNKRFVFQSIPELSAIDSVLIASYKTELSNFTSGKRFLRPKTIDDYFSEALSI